MVLVMYVLGCAAAVKCDRTIEVSGGKIGCCCLKLLTEVSGCQWYWCFNVFDILAVIDKQGC